MAEIKVITVQAGQELFDALTKLLGSEVAAQVKTAVDEAGLTESGEVAVGDECPECSCPECSGDFGDEIVEVEFGEVLDDFSDEVGFYRVYDVTGAADLSVDVTPAGVVVKGTRYEENENGEEDSTFEDLFAPNGAYDEVTAEYDEENATLTVNMFKVADEGTAIEIDGWDF